MHLIWYMKKYVSSISRLLRVNILIYFWTHFEYLTKHTPYKSGISIFISWHTENKILQSTGYPLVPASKILCMFAWERDAAYSHQHDVHPESISQGGQAMKDWLGQSLWKYNLHILTPQVLKKQNCLSTAINTRNYVKNKNLFSY